MAASSQHQTEVVRADLSPSLDDTSLVSLRALPADQRQALLFLATSSGVLATSNVSEASDLQLLAALSVDKGQVISFLVNNPFVTLGVAVALYIIVPRILRFATKYILLPVSIAGLVYLVITNPNTSLGVVSTGFKCEYAAAVLHTFHNVALSSAQSHYLYASASLGALPQVIYSVVQMSLNLLSHLLQISQPTQLSLA